MGNKHFDNGYALIRIISTFIIVSFHYSIELLAINYNGFTNYFRDGNCVIAVTMFFILSGATLYKNNPCVKLSAFYKKRFLSIYPFFWFCFIPLALVRCITSRSLTLGLNPIKYVLSLAGMDGYFLYLGPNYYLIGEWFLGMIIFLYLLYPFLIFFVNKGTVARIITTLFVITGYVFVLNTDLFKIDVTRNVIYCVLWFYLGILFEFYKGERDLDNKILPVSLLILILFSIAKHFTDTRSIELLLYIPIVTSLFFILYFLGNNIKFLNTAKSNKNVMKKIGGYTFSVFFVHHLIIFALTKSLIGKINNSLIVFIVELIIIVVVSVLVQEVFSFFRKLIARKNK